MSDTALQVVVIPDLFTSFLATPPSINPHYRSARKESEQWLARSWQCDLKARKRLNGIDASYFCAILAPKADHDRFRLICDWTNWVFPFDDLFDDGALRGDPGRAALLIGKLLDVMQDDAVAKEPMSRSSPPMIGAAGSEQRLVDCYTNIWERFKARTERLGVRERFTAAMQDYCHGALQQVQDCSTGTSRDLEDLLAVRRSSVAVLPLYSLVEFAHRLDVPKQVFEHDSIQRIRALALDVILIQNDILSYQKEEAEDVRHNLITACRCGGMSAQEAFDHLGSLLEARLERFDELSRNLPLWESPTTVAAVDAYIEGVRNAVQANLYWSLRSDRFFGAAAEEVKKSRRVKVIVRPKYLQVGA